MTNSSKKVIGWVAVIVFAATLCACQKNPAQNVVTSKNDGSFDVNVVQSATEQEGAETTETTEMLAYNDTFYSTDGTVEFSLDIHQEMTHKAMPVVEIEPYYLTEADAQRVAKVLFGEVDFYEAAPLSGKEYSKQEIQSCIDRWLPYTNVNAVSELFPNRSGETEYLSLVVETIKKSIEDFTAQYENAPDEKTETLCDWTFKPDSYYRYAVEEIDKKDLSQDNQKLAVQVTVDGIPYYLAFTKRNMGDYKLNYIYSYPYSGFSPCDIDKVLLNAKLCRTEEPTAKQINAAKEKAQDLLDRMNLGTWTIDSYSIETKDCGNCSEFAIKVNAVPMIAGIPAVRCPQYVNLKSELAYASNYYLTDASFTFSANGTLLNFEMLSTIAVKEVINDCVAVLPMEELIERAATHLSLSDYQEYGLSGDFLEQLQETAGEKYLCKIDISKLDYGMLRVKAPNTDESYYYVPGIVLSGSIDYCGAQTGAIYESSGKTILKDRIVPLVTLNAVDGTIVELYTE